MIERCVNHEGDMDTHSYHEALDRAYIQLSSLENALGDHPVILNNKDINILYRKAIRSLSDLYQKLGEVDS